MDKKFLTAFALPEYFEIYGFKLRPLCAKSLLALHASDSPLVSEKEPTSRDILNFLRICSVDFDGFFKMEKPTWSQMYFCYKMDYWPLFKMRVLLGIKIFIEESTASPLVRTRNQTSKESVMMDKQSLPELLMMVTVLMSKVGMSEKEALELPIGKAICYSVAYAALEGSDIVMVPDEGDESQEIKKEIMKHQEEMAERMRLAMNNGVVPKKTIKIRRT